MKKSPLSTPSSSTVKHAYGCKPQEEVNGIGYSQVRVQNCYYKPRDGNQRSLRDDFIPLNQNVSQNAQDGHVGSRYGSGSQRYYQNSNSWFNCANNQYKNSSPHNSYSPYKQSTNIFRGRNKKGQKEIPRRTNISNYVNLRSFLEDPWAELVKKLGKPKQDLAEESKIPQECGTPVEKIDSQQRVFDTACIENLNDSGLSQGSRNDTLDESLGSSEQDASQVSKADSSVDLKFDEMTFAQDINADTDLDRSGEIKEKYKSTNADDVAADTEGKCK